MKHIVITLTGVFFSICYAADPVTYMPLEQITIDTPEDETERLTVTIKTLFNGGVRPENQTLNISKRGLTSVHDLPRYRHSLNFLNLTVFDVSKNHLGSEDLGTILRALVQLKTLNMGFNKVTSLAMIPSHQHLETLLLNDNKIDTLDFANFFGKLSRLRQCTLHNNVFRGTAIINCTGFDPSLEELWFGHDVLTEHFMSRLIQVCPNITSEFCAGSNLVQQHYSKIEQQYDDCDECNNGDCIFMYGYPPILGSAIGLIPAALVTLTDVSFGTGCAIFIPVCAVAAPIIARIGKTIRNYCRTKPEDRYVTVPTRQISAEPQLLDLIEDDVETVPDQEQEEEENVV